MNSAQVFHRRDRSESALAFEESPLAINSASHIALEGGTVAKQGGRSAGLQLPIGIGEDADLLCWIRKSNIGPLADKVSNGSVLPRPGWRGKLEEVILISAFNSSLAATSLSSPKISARGQVLA
jgi:hypothetical protein